MFTVTTFSHSGPDWSGGCHALQTFNDEAGVVAYCAENWDRAAIEEACAGAVEDSSGLRQGSRTVESAEGEDYSVYLEISFRVPAGDTRYRIREVRADGSENRPRFATGNAAAARVFLEECGGEVNAPGSHGDAMDTLLQTGRLSCEIPDLATTIIAERV